LKYPPASRVALLTLKGRSEEKVKFSAEHLKRELEKILKPSATNEASLPASLFENFEDGSRGRSPHPQTKDSFKDLIIAGPAPAPLLRAENFYRYQIMLRTRAMSALSREMAQIVESLKLPEEVSLVVDIDPVNLS
jgi:primosomal protein N'